MPPPVPYDMVAYDPCDAERQHAETVPEGEVRSPFEVDRSRIVHSEAFRRLQGKTQVFGIGEGDFYRSRLTHTLEVAQIGKGLALRLGADTDLVEAVCLAHDLGHPPFGHTGEEVLNERMAAFGGFEANAQTLRLLARLEPKRTDFPGLNLTRATLDGLLKYKRFRPEAAPPTPQTGMGAPKGLYGADRPTVEWIDPCHARMPARSFECQIMDWADDIAYSVHDVEDGIKAKKITAADLHEPRLRESVLGHLARFAPSDWPHGRIEATVEPVFTRVERAVVEWRRGGERDEVLKSLTSAVISEFIRAAERGERPDPPSGSARYRFDLRVPMEMRLRAEAMKWFVWELVIQNAEIWSLEVKAKRIVGTLFDDLMSDQTGHLFPVRFRERLSACRDDPLPKARLVCDLVAGLTDASASRLYARLTQPNAGSIFDVL